MKKVLYFDCFSGISGDMTLGALLDLGIDIELFRNELNKLGLSGYDIVIEEKTKNGIKGMDVQVILTEEDHHSSGHSHVHTHTHVHTHNHNHNHNHNHHNHSERNLKDIECIIDMSHLKQNVKDFSKKVFREIARAEAKVHNKSIEEVHFHEVGAVDSIVDIVGTAICIDLLGVKKVLSSPLHDGKGFIECQHGTIPVPVPAVMEMLSGSGIPLITVDVNTELVTPTGMGLIKCLSSDYGAMPPLTIEKVGYGMGKRETGRFNALRVVMGSLLENENAMEEIVVLQTNIDDMSPELLGFAVENLLENGALDVFYTPVYMKKNRPAVMLTVLANKEQEHKMVDIMFKETSTLGVRRDISSRYAMDRKLINISTKYGEAKVKVATRGLDIKFAPEYEDCREIAKKNGISIAKVYDTINAEVNRLLSDEENI